MEEKLIEFPTAKLAKEKGFKNNTLSYYLIDNKSIMNNEIGKLGSYDCCSYNPKYGYTQQDIIAAPTQSLLAKWLREVHNIKVFINENLSGYFYQIVFVEDKMHCRIDSTITKCLPIYENILEIALFEALKLIK